MNLFQVLADVNTLCNDALVQAVVGTVKNVLTTIQVAVPIILIVLCTIDMFKAFTNGDDKERSKAWKGAIKRLVFAVIVFIVPWLVKLGLSLLGKLIDTNGQVSGFETFLVCWEAADGKFNNNNNNNNNGKLCCKVGTGRYLFVEECDEDKISDAERCE